MCFANNLMELGRTSILEYDIERVPNITPIRLKPYSVPCKHRGTRGNIRIARSRVN